MQKNNPLFKANNFRLSFIIANLLLLFTLLCIAGLYYFEFTVTLLLLDPRIVLLLAVQYAFTFFLVYYRIEKFVHKRITQVYEDLTPIEYTNNKKAIETDIEALSTGIKKFASDQKLEIELLKDKENYRKEFIGNISHELKTPLFTVQGYILTLLDGAVKDKKTRMKYLKRAAKGVERLTYIIRDLDLINKFESGIKTIDWSTFDIVEVAENVLELLEMQAIKNNINLEFDIPYETPILVHADAERIMQVVTNLVINSLKYGVDGGTTEISFQDMGNDKLLIRVTDNGEGIDEEHLPRLFERFYRVDRTGNRSQGGSGLGLAIVKHVIDAHQEKIFVESSYGVGSEFSFTLQRASEEQITAEIDKKNEAVTLGEQE
ncbi:MAG: sensor histidine kinase [Flavobacteriaceae bacterium]